VPGIVGFCCNEAYPFGPVQANVDPATVDDPVRLIEEPWHTGELLDAVAIGVGFTVTITFCVFVQPLAVNVYT
jgi:hypothetical protein